MLTARRPTEPRDQWVMPDAPEPATLTMSVYFHATADDLAEAGAGYVLNEATGSRGAQNTSGQQARLWSPTGALLATTEQLAWYR